MAAAPTFKIKDDDPKYWTVILDDQAKRIRFGKPGRDDPDVRIDVGVTKDGRIVPARVYFPRRKYTRTEVEGKKEAMVEGYASCPVCAKVKAELAERKEKGTIIRDEMGEPVRWVSPPRTPEEWEQRTKSPVLIEEEIETPIGVLERTFVPFRLRDEIRRKYGKEIAKKSPGVREDYILRKAHEIVADKLAMDTTGKSVGELIAAGEAPPPPHVVAKAAAKLFKDLVEED